MFATLCSETKPLTFVCTLLRLAEEDLPKKTAASSSPLKRTLMFLARESV